jgi:acetyl-CoA acetyltransferase
MWSGALASSTTHTSCSADPEATVTAGNSSGQNDAAAVAIVTTPDRADELGLRPLARMIIRSARQVAASWRTCFDLELLLADAAQADRAMDERRAIKALLTV